MDDLLQFFSNPTNVLYICISLPIFLLLGMIAYLFLFYSLDRQARRASNVSLQPERKRSSATSFQVAANIPIDDDEPIEEVLGPMIIYRDPSEEQSMLPAHDVIKRLQHIHTSLFNYLLRRAFLFQGRSIPHAQNDVIDGIIKAAGSLELPIFAVSLDSPVEYQNAFGVDERLIVSVEVCHDCIQNNPMAQGGNALSFAKGVALNILCQAVEREVSAIIRIASHINQAQVVQLIRPESFDKAVEMTLWSKVYNETDPSLALKSAFRDAYLKHAKYRRTHVIFITDHTGTKVTLSKEEVERYKTSHIYLHCIVIGEDIQKLRDLAHTYKMYPKLRRDDF